MISHTTFSPILVVTTPSSAQLVVTDAIHQYLPEFPPSQAVWLSPPDQIPSIEQLRDMIYQLSFRLGPNESRVFVIPQLDHAQVELSHTLLKTLEEPPARTLILLTVDSTYQLLPTLTSRCQTYQVTVSNSVRPEIEQPWFDLAQRLNQFLFLPTASLYQLWSQLPKSISNVQAIELLNHLSQVLLPHRTMGFGRQMLQNILTAISQLQHNTHVKLTLENCLLQLYVLAKAVKNAPKLSPA